METTITQFVKNNITDFKKGDVFNVIDNNTGKKYAFKACNTPYGVKIKADDEHTTVLCLQDRKSFYSLIK